MNIKSDFVLRQVVDTWVVLPLEEKAVDFSGMLTLNNSGAMLWNLLEQGADKQALVDAITQKYDVTPQQAAIDVDEFIDILRQAGCIEEP